MTGTVQFWNQLLSETRVLAKQLLNRVATPKHEVRRIGCIEAAHEPEQMPHQQQQQRSNTPMPVSAISTLGNNSLHSNSSNNTILNNNNPYPYSHGWLIHREDDDDDLSEDDILLPSSYTTLWEIQLDLGEIPDMISNNILQPCGEDDWRRYSDATLCSSLLERESKSTTASCGYEQGGAYPGLQPRWDHATCRFSHLAEGGLE